MKQEKWCIRANSFEEAEVLFPLFNQEARKNGMGWSFDLKYYESQKHYYVYFEGKKPVDTNNGNKEPDYKEYSYNQFRSIFFNESFKQIHELW